jgi:ribonuclease HI
MERHDDNALIIYADGSCLQRPRRGGWAYRLVTTTAAGEELALDFPGTGYRGATNNQMELMACIEALKDVAGRRPSVPRDTYEKIVIYTDSMYVLDNVYQAEFVWPTTKWLTRENEPVLNADLWKDLVRLKQRAGRVEFRRVQGHKTNPHNKAVDKLAKESARSAYLDMTPAPMVARKRSPRKTEPRVVAMRGQQETIRILVVRDVPGQPYHAYKYEVVSEDSPDFQAVDDAFALDGEVELRRSHIYQVRFSPTGKGRWIEEVLAEVLRR